MTGGDESQKTPGISTICSLSKLIPRGTGRITGAVRDRGRTVSSHRQAADTVCLDGVTPTGSKAFHIMRKVANDDE